MVVIQFRAHHFGELRGNGEFSSGGRAVDEHEQHVGWWEMEVTESRKLWRGSSFGPVARFPISFAKDGQTEKKLYWKALIDLNVIVGLFSLVSTRDQQRDILKKGPYTFDTTETFNGQ